MAVYSEIITLFSEDVAAIDNYLNGEEPLYECETITNTATFSNGYQMDIKLCGVGDENDWDDINGWKENGFEPWTEAVLFNEDGGQLAFTDPCDSYMGEWSIQYNDDIYTVSVMEGRR